METDHLGISEVEHYSKNFSLGILDLVEVDHLTFDLGHNWWTKVKMEGKHAAEL